MNKLWLLTGTICYWLFWPALWFYLHGSRRTRVMVICDGRLLVTKPWLGNGSWALPGGGRHHHEAALPGAQRELREETGIVIDESDLVNIGEQLFSSHGLSFTYELFTLELAEQPVIYRQAFEIVATKWFTPEELLVERLGSDVRTALRHWPQ